MTTVAARYTLLVFCSSAFMIIVTLYRKIDLLSRQLIVTMIEIRGYDYPGILLDEEPLPQGHCYFPLIAKRLDLSHAHYPLYMMLREMVCNNTLTPFLHFLEHT